MNIKEIVVRDSLNKIRISISESVIKDSGKELACESAAFFIKTCYRYADIVPDIIIENY